MLRRRIPDFLLLIGGAGSLRAHFERLAASLDLQPHVRFLGFIPEADLPRYYQAADAFVLPTRELEGFGLVTVEALACGTPVLGTAVGATPEILRPLNPLLLFRDQTPEAMAEHLGRLLETHLHEREAIRHLRWACRRHVEEHYNWDASVHRLELTLSAVASAGDPRTSATREPHRTVR
jgi:glycosyltransferase involved in cell wall biosynthesis